MFPTSVFPHSCFFFALSVSSFFGRCECESQTCSVEFSFIDMKNEKMGMGEREKKTFNTISSSQYVLVCCFFGF